MIKSRNLLKTVNYARCFSSKPDNASSIVDKVIDYVKDFALYRKDAPDYLNYPKKNAAGKGYRTPSPASHVKPNIPKYESIDDIYNIQTYTKEKPPEVVEIDVGDKKYIVGEINLEGSSVGNKNPDVLRYDPTGTRSAMTTTNEAMLAEQMKHVPNHLPTPFWEFDEETLEQEAKRKNLPFVIGRESKWARSTAVYAYE